MMDELRALLRLRGLELKFAFRAAEGVGNLITYLLVLAILAPGAVLLAFGAALLGASCARPETLSPLFILLTHLLFAGNFFIYQLTHLFHPRPQEAFDLKRLQPFPIPLARLYRWNLLASALDAVFLFFLPSQIAFAVGFAVAAGWNALGVVALLVLFNGLNLAWSSLVAVGMGRLTAIRWRKDVLVLLLPLVALVIYLLPYWWVQSRTTGSGTSWAELAPTITRFLEWFPSGWLAGGIVKLGAGQGFAAELLLLATGCWLGYRLGLRLTRSSLLMREGGRPAGDSRGPARASSKDRRKAGWKIPGLSPAFSALFEKELKYLLRSSQGRYAFIWPIVLILMLRIFLTRSAAAVHLAELFSSFALLPFVAFFFLFFLPFYVNLFAYDHRGVKIYFLAPVSLREVLLAKNLAVFVLGLLCFGEVVALYLVSFHSLSFPALAHALGSLAAGFLVLLGGGNVVSCYFPKSLKMSAIHGNSPPHVAVWLGMILLGLALSLMTLSAGVGRWAGWGWAIALLAGIFLAGGLLYTLTLGAVVRLYKQRREPLLEHLTRQEIQE